MPDYTLSHLDHLESEAIFILLTNRVHPTAREIDFQRVRNEFHQVAAALIAG